MLAEIIFIAVAGVIDPMDMTGHQMYPSGVKDVDKYPKYAPPISKLAKLSLPRNIIANDGQTIKSGHYLVSLSVSMNEILFFEGTNAIYTLKVSDISYGDRFLKLSTAEFFNENTNQGLIILKQGKLKVEAVAEFAQSNINTEK